MAQASLNRVLEEIKTLEPAELLMVEYAIRARLPEQNSMPTSSKLTHTQIEKANARLRETIVTLSVPVGTENEGIDTDLALEYSDNHSALNRFKRDK